MKNLFYILFLLLTSLCAHAQDAAHMTFVNKDSVYDFGGIPLGLTVTYQFEVKNTGNVPLTISGMTSKSPNLKLKWPAKAIKPGKKNYLSVTYTSQGDAGSFDDNVSITGNAWPGAQPLIRIKGAIVPATGEYMPPAKSDKNMQIHMEASPSPLIRPE